MEVGDEVVLIGEQGAREGDGGGCGEADGDDPLRGAVRDRGAGAADGGGLTMLKELYGRWMVRWETALTTQDENRVVRPLEWGFEWLADFIDAAGLRARVERARGNESAAEAAMIAVNEAIIGNSDAFFGYERPTDFRLEERAPQLFPTNVRPETVRRDAQLKQRMAEGKLKKAQFLRFTSPVRTPYPENDRVNARWYPAPAERMQGKPRAGDDRDAAVECGCVQP